MHGLRRPESSLQRATSERLTDESIQVPDLTQVATKEDTLVCHLKDRLGQNLNDLRKILLELAGRPFTHGSLKKASNFTDGDCPMANLFLSAV